MFRKNRMVMTGGFCRPVEKLRQAIEVLFGQRIEFREYEIKRKNDSVGNSSFSLEGVILIFGSNCSLEEQGFQATVTIDNSTAAVVDSSFMFIINRTVYLARWESLKDTFIAPVRVIPYHPANTPKSESPQWWVGTGRDDRHQELLFPIPASPANTE